MPSKICELDMKSETLDAKEFIEGSPKFPPKSTSFTFFRKTMGKRISFKIRELVYSQV